VVEADEIIVLQEGAIAERGTHASLIAAGGLYAEMWRRQAQAVAAAEAAAAARAAELEVPRAARHGEDLAAAE
jgi:ATP-binding cassette subfamily B protein